MMKTVQFLVEFLKGMEIAIPPSNLGHHAITFARYGSDETKWEDKLALQINDSGVLRCVFLDEDDVQKNPELLIAEITKMLSTPFPQEQIGVSGARYVKSKEETRVITESDIRHLLMLIEYSDTYGLTEHAAWACRLGRRKLLEELLAELVAKNGEFNPGS